MSTGSWSRRADAGSRVRGLASCYTEIFVDGAPGTPCCSVSTSNKRSSHSVRDRRVRREERLWPEPSLSSAVEAADFDNQPESRSTPTFLSRPLTQRSTSAVVAPRWQENSCCSSPDHAAASAPTYTKERSTGSKNLRSVDPGFQVFHHNVRHGLRQRCPAWWRRLHALTLVEHFTRESPAGRSRHVAARRARHASVGAVGGRVDLLRPIVWDNGSESRGEALDHWADRRGVAAVHSAQ